MIKHQYSVTNALAKWLKTDLPRLPAAPGQQVGVQSISSTDTQMCWQLHIIANSYGSRHKTIIATEANSRFTVFIPVDMLMTLEQLAKRLQMEWQFVLAESLQLHSELPPSDSVQLLSDLSDLPVITEWIKNTDLSVNGHVADAGLWVTDTLADRKLAALPPLLALELAIHVNTQPKRIKKSRRTIIPLQQMLAYCLSILNSGDAQQGQVVDDELRSNKSNVVSINDFRK